eukprot:1830840-Rhodomonas_salina.2
MLSGFRVQGLGVSVSGLGFRVPVQRIRQPSVLREQNLVAAQTVAVRTQQMAQDDIKHHTAEANLRHRTPGADSTEGAVACVCFRRWCSDCGCSSKISQRKRGLTQLNVSGVSRNTIRFVDARVVRSYKGSWRPMRYVRTRHPQQNMPRRIRHVRNRNAEQGTKRTTGHP